MSDPDREPDDDEIVLMTDIELVDLDTLVPYANNPKKHPDEQVQKIANSIRQYGMDQPIVIDESGEIIKGHGRYQAAQRLGLDVVPVIWRNGLTPPEVKAARIVDNKTQLETGFDYDVLSTEVQQLTQRADLDTVAVLTGIDLDQVRELAQRGETHIDDFFAGRHYPGGDPPPEHDPEADGPPPDPTEGDGTGMGDADDPAMDSPGEGLDSGRPPGSPDLVFRCPDCGHSFPPAEAAGDE